MEFRLWREAVFTRDNWTCQKCNRNGGYLHPHHIRNFAEEIDLRFAINNGITFCKACHKEFHKIYGVKNNYQNQVNEFRKLKNILKP
jgi:5-methylcytosine-specific restriction endonuclease McrA